uniref:Uncharacterized protein n=1 Tax=Anguilla anguilla TaxID=7936 RepID=A0A0E9RHH7_ANGAN
MNSLVMNPHTNKNCKTPLIQQYPIVCDSMLLGPALGKSQLSEARARCFC